MSVDKTKYIKWYKLARDVIKDDALIPNRIDEEITSDCVSTNDWLSFPPGGKDKKKVAESPKPNIFFRIKENENVIGLTFDKNQSIETLKNILLPYFLLQKKELIDKLSGLDSNWKTVLFKKTTKAYGFAKPNYEMICSFDTDKIKSEDLDNFFNECDNVIREGKEKTQEERKKKYKRYFEGASVNLMRININLNEEEFKKRIVEAFDILRICLEVKSVSEIKRAEKEEDSWGDDFD